MAATKGLPVTAEGDVERVARGVPALDFGHFPGMHSFSQHEDAYGRGRWCHWCSTWERDIPMGAVCRSPETGLPNNSTPAPSAYAPGERDELIGALRALLRSNETSFTAWPATLGEVEVRNAAVAALAKAEAR